MREAPDLFIACNKSRIGRAKLIRTKYRSGKIHFPRFHKSLVWPFSWTNNSKKVWRYKVPSMYHLLGHWCLFHIILVFTPKSTKPMPFESFCKNIHALNYYIYRFGLSESLLLCPSPTPPPKDTFLSSLDT